MNLSSADFEYVRSLIRKEAAIVLEDDKAYFAESRLLQLARKEGLPSVSALLDQVRAGLRNALYHKVIDAMTTNETSFFRDIHPFEALRKTLLPEMLERRKPDRRLTIWCGASSTGQEPYSIAMLLREHFGSYLNWNIRIFATDLSTDVLARANKGCFSQLEVNRGLSAALLVKYFQRNGLEWQIKDEIRRMVEFKQLNLIGNWAGLPTADFVFLRNVLIYFDVATKKQILGKIRQSLRRDGYLFLGGAETTFNLDDAFERVTLERTGCYRLR